MQAFRQSKRQSLLVLVEAPGAGVEQMLWNRGDYVRPIELVKQHLNART
jgi:hypothetical protein